MYTVKNNSEKTNKRNTRRVALKWTELFMAVNSCEQVGLWPQFMAALKMVSW
jgi:hypothetical protein